MAVNTILLDFSVDPDQVKNQIQQNTLAQNIENVLRDYLTNLSVLNSLPLDGGLFKLYTSDMGATTALRIFNNGLITLNIDYFKGEKQEPIFNFDVSTFITYISCKNFKTYI